MKKIFSVFLIFIISVSFVINANAVNFGDIIDQTLYTDIIARINNYNIESFNIGGYTTVVAEDLRNYGFDVEWKDNERALYITRNKNNKIGSTYIAPQISKEMVGKKAYDVLYTDIKTYINGVYVPSYNIGGRTVIYFDNLNCFGKINYDNDIRKLDLTIDDGLEFYIERYPNSDTPTFTEITGIKLKNIHTFNDGKKIYIYNLIDEKSIIDYRVYLDTNGWKNQDVNMDADSLTTYHSRNGKLTAISTRYDYKEIWILPPNNN